MESLSAYVSIVVEEKVHMAEIRYLTHVLSHYEVCLIPKSSLPPDCLHIQI